MWNKVDDLENNLKDLDICWIIDGYQERSQESVQFLDSLKKQFNPNYHSVIVTTKNDGRYSVSSDVLYAESILEDLHCFWDRFIYEKDIKIIIMNQLGTLLNVSKWFTSLCKVAAESLRDDSIILSNDQITFLKEKCAGLCLLDHSCLPMFLSFDLRNEFEDEDQRNTMASLYIRDLDYEQQKEFFKEAPLNSEFVPRFLNCLDRENVYFSDQDWSLYIVLSIFIGKNSFLKIKNWVA